MPKTCRQFFQRCVSNKVVSGSTGASQGFIEFQKGPGNQKRVVRFSKYKRMGTTSRYGYLIVQTSGLAWPW